MESITDTEFEDRIASVSPYYQMQFRKIRESNEAYKGKWNWWAFLLAPFWLLAKKQYWLAALAIIGTILTGGIGAIANGLIFGWRGEYSYYRNHVIKDTKVF